MKKLFSEKTIMSFVMIILICFVLVAGTIAWFLKDSPVLLHALSLETDDIGILYVDIKIEPYKVNLDQTDIVYSDILTNEELKSETYGTTATDDGYYNITRMSLKQLTAINAGTPIYSGTNDVSGETDSPENAQEEVISGEASAEETVSGEAVAEETISREAISEETAAEETVSGEATSEETVSGEAVAEETISEETTAEENILREVISGEATSTETNQDSEQVIIDMGQPSLNSIEDGKLGPGAFGEVSLYIMCKSEMDMSYHLQITPNINLVESAYLTEEDKNTTLPQMIADHIRFYEVRTEQGDNERHPYIYENRIPFVDEEDVSKGMYVEGVLTTMVEEQVNLYWYWPYEYIDIPEYIRADADITEDEMQSISVTSTDIESYDIGDTMIGNYVTHVTYDFTVTGDLYEETEGGE